MTTSALGELTPRQREILDWIVAHYCRTGCWPSIRDIGQAMRISSPNGVRGNLQVIAGKGWLDLGSENRKARSIRLSEQAISHYRLCRPVAGGVLLRLMAPQTYLTSEQAREIYHQLGEALDGCS